MLTKGDPKISAEPRRSNLHPGRRALFIVAVLFASSAQGLLAATISLSNVEPFFGFMVATLLATCGIALVFAAGLQSA